jgi:hypothetical protein
MSLDDVLANFQASTEELAVATARAVLAVYVRMVSGEITQDQAVLTIAATVNRSNASAVTLADAYVAAQIESAAGVPTLSTGVSPVDDSERLVKAVQAVLAEPPKTKLTPTDVRHALADVGLDPSDWDISEATSITNRMIADKVNELADEDDDWTPADRMTAHDEHGRLMGVDFLETIVEESESPAAGAVWEKLQAGDFDDLPAVWEHAPADAAMRLERMARAEPLEATQVATIDAIQQQELVEGWTRQMDADPCQLCQWWWREGRIWPKEHPFQSHKGCNCQPKIVVAEHIESTQFTRRLARNAG